ncbi:hypothetical protein [Brucella pseudintermedia]|uniref:hypothetical protein n=1 Tax=Brucella pseudintermedia TaxID=370111 RepID=UPI0030F4AAD9
MARPKLGESETERLHVKITKDEIEAIDDWRYKNRIPSRSEAVRRLCRLGLDADDFFDDMVTKLLTVQNIIVKHDLDEDTEFSKELSLKFYEVMQQFMKIRQSVISMRSGEPIDEAISEIKYIIDILNKRDKDYFNKVRSAILGLPNKDDDK